MTGMWRVALLGLVASAMLVAACGGGGVRYATVQYGSAKYAATVVPITRPDLSTVAISAASVANPPQVDQYPAVVAEVNGKALTGKQLGSELVLLELGRRNLLKTTPDALPPGYVSSQLQEAKSTDPLTLIIDEEIKKQAVERLGLSPTHDEAVAYTRQLEASFEKALPQMAPDRRAQQIDVLRQEGFPARDWASADNIVQFYQGLMGLTRLENKVCPEYVTPMPTPTDNGQAILGFANVLSGGKSCAAFLANERKNAKVVYYVRWAD